jgi:Protein of unknown function (DUF3300)
LLLKWWCSDGEIGGKHSDVSLRKAAADSAIAHTALALHQGAHMIHRTNQPAPSQQILALLVCGCLVLTVVQTGCATQPAQTEIVVPSNTQSQPVSSASVPSAQPSSQQLGQLVAPIALYPDALVAQVLAASTYPAQIVEADRWMQQNSSLKGDALAKAVDQQPWDDSVKALAQFPTVLEMMDKNLSWTSSLGEAYGTNQAAVMDAVQQMRQKAQQAGNLKSTPQQTVTSQGQTIVIEPANPEVVYVPEYDPWLIYGAPIGFYPGWVGFPGLFVGGPGLFFGVGFGIGAFGGFGWGWHHWAPDWRGHYVGFNHRPWVSRSPTFGHFPGGRPGAFGHPGVGGHPGDFHPGGFGHPGGAPATHSSAFSGFNHGGVAHAYADRGAASRGFHGGGFHGGGFHGGGGHR